MSKLNYDALQAVLDQTATTLIKAAGDDPFISRRDIQKKLKGMKGLERSLVDILYRYTNSLDTKPGARVTQKDVKSAVQNIEYALYSGEIDLSTIGVSFFEIETFTKYGHWAILLITYLKRVAITETFSSGQQLAEELEVLARGLIVTNFQTEAEAGFWPFHKEANLERLTQDAFEELIDLKSYEWPFNETYLFTEMDDYFIMDFLLAFDEWEYLNKLAGQAREFIATMRATLRDIHFAILGDGGDHSNHPTFWLGIDKNNDLVGLRTETIWT